MPSCRRVLVLTVLAVLSPAARALPDEVASDTGDKLIAALEGVYKRQFQNAYYAGPDQPDERYQSEDVVELVRYDRTSLYVRAKLEFYNGHTCGIYGIARFEDGAFVYRDGDPTSQPPCVLRVQATKTQLVLTDGAGTCSSYCGARGSFTDYKIERRRQRPIRYMARLKASKEYAEAVAAFERTKPKPWSSR